MHRFDDKLTCSECGSVIHVDGDVPVWHCDNCNKSLCYTCWNNLQIQHVTTPTNTGVTGFVKLCKDCQQIVDGVRVQPNQYIG